jgi:methionine sulfoxide reductase catalytic subunit
MRKKAFESGIPSSLITPESVYLSRRKLLKLGALGLGSMALAGCDAPATPAPTVVPTAASAPAAGATAPAVKRDELGDAATAFDEITSYNNYYEFTTDKEDVARKAASFNPDPWTLEVGGLVNKPYKLGFEDLRTRFGEEERIYRLRCVEGWSMVIPWLGFPLHKMLREADPKSEAKYVKFTSLLDSARMPGQNDPWYTWPYVEGLRMDEAMHDLTLMATGLYGRAMPNQNGAPIRLAVPWKYGFKSIKAIVRVDLVAEQPTSLWMSASPGEYGFYSNVNPGKAHPRWSQASERRIGETSRRRTLMFNGYESQVAALYTGQDLQRDY